LQRSNSQGSRSVIELLQALNFSEAALFNGFSWFSPERLEFNDAGSGPFDYPREWQWRGCICAIVSP
jgi:hypothetical protein